MYNGKTLAVVIPAYNEELLIADTIKSVPQYVDKVFVVDDGSNDRTAEIVRPFVNSRIHLISHDRNMGVGAAIASGYKQALKDNMDVAVVMAGDFQMDPKYIVDLITPVIENSADYTKGDRLSTPGYQVGMSIWRRLGNWLLTRLTWIAMGSRQISDPQHGYTAISRNALEKIKVNTVYSGYGYCNDILVKLVTYGLTVIDIQMPAKYGNERSKIKYGSYIPRVSWLLLKGFLWRLRMTYLGGKKRHLQS